jgi:hypothetical protein
MPYPQLDRHALDIKPLSARQNKLRVDCDFVSPDQPQPSLPAAAVDEIAARVRSARRAGRPVILAFGAHTIKNGLAPVLIRLIERGWVTHLATNGAGIIHDWEFAYQGMSSEDVRGGVARGEFGLWQETGFFINLALVVGAYEGLGYGESVGRLIEREGLSIPGEDELRGEGGRWEVAGGRREDDGNKQDPSPNTQHLSPVDPLARAAAALDLLEVIRRFGLKPGWMAVPHPHKAFSAQAAAHRLGVPFTGHPMFGHDIIYNHPMNHGAAIGRTAERDFLAFAHTVSRLQDGVYLSVGSAVMSPMIFEKALSMAQNLSLQSGTRIDRHFIAVVDLAESRWDWQKDGEPPMENPAYYLRYCKTFSRMGGAMRYIAADNRDFLLALSGRLSRSP